MLDLHNYDYYLVSMSGGKDSTAVLLWLLGRGVDVSKIELWHQLVDGGREHTLPLMVWPFEEDYVNRLGEHFGIRVLHQYKQGGFEREMLRDQSLTAPTCFQLGDRSWQTKGGTHGKPNTRQMFPQVSADLRCRWCSGVLKVDPMDMALRNDPRFRGKKTLVLTGERAQESANRARYKTEEPHRADARDGKLERYIDHRRPVHQWQEQHVWNMLQGLNIRPAPAYFLGWGRLSCLSCIFGSPNQWASVRQIAPDWFERIAQYEEQFNHTIHRTKNVRQLADAGTPYPTCLDPDLVRLAMSRTYTGPITGFELPAGAYGENVGPS